jgi:hypothetical protein
MRTQMMIGLIVATIFLGAVAVLAGLIVWLGWAVGLLVALGALALLVAGYFAVIKPWHLRWGATDAEVAMAMPGDDLIPEADPATRAISIEGTAEEVWPWLVQLGFGKAGWYSYDWIDNDFRRSAERIIPEYQDLAVGDTILMMPAMGFEVKAIDRPHSIVSILEDGTTSWCLGLYPADDGRTRLVSRWRPHFDVTPATFFMVALSEPGSFIMEQKMLRTIKDRVETHGARPDRA